MLKHNVITSLGRPSRLSMDEQQRYTGVLNFGQRLTI